METAQMAPTEAALLAPRVAQLLLTALQFQGAQLGKLAALDMAAAAAVAQVKMAAEGTREILETDQMLGKAAAGVQ